MSGRKLLCPASRRRILRIGLAILVLAGAVVALDRMRGTPGEEAWFSTPHATDRPIPAESDVFRVRPGDLALDLTAEPRASARRRTLADFRRLRAYPGAPPSIPHTLTTEEFRGMTCNACHEGGGYSSRFAAYTPVTPHPEYRNCLQCHAADAERIEFVTPGSGSVALASSASVRFVPLDWRTTDWPRIDQRGMEGGPPIIPHDLHLRGNCLACHGGPSAVAEIRTTHPERANCRQCHMAEDHFGSEEFFRRPLRSTGAAGGAP